METYSDKEEIRKEEWETPEAVVYDMAASIKGSAQNANADALDNGDPTGS